MKIVTSQDSSVQQESGSPASRVTIALARRAGRQRYSAQVPEPRRPAILCDVEQDRKVDRETVEALSGSAIGAAPIYALSIPERQTGRVISALARLVRETPDSPARPLYCLDGGNAFNPYRLTTWMRRRGYAPTPWLDHIFVSRAYTCHQLISSAETLLAPLAAKPPYSGREGHSHEPPAKPVSTFNALDESPRPDNFQITDSHAAETAPTPPAKPVSTLNALDESPRPDNFQVTDSHAAETESAPNYQSESRAPQPEESKTHLDGAPVKPASPGRVRTQHEPNLNALNETLTAGPVVALLGVDHLFLDEDLPMWERRYLFGRLMNLVAKYTSEGLPMLITFGVERPNPWARQIARVARVLPGPGDGQPDRLGESLEKIEAAFSSAGAGNRIMAATGTHGTNQTLRRHRPDPFLNQPTINPPMNLLMNP